MDEKFRQVLFYLGIGIGLLAIGILLYGIIVSL